MGNEIVWHNKVGGRSSKEFVRANALPNRPLIAFSFEDSKQPAFDEYECEGMVAFKDGQIVECFNAPGQDPWFKFELVWYVKDTRKHTFSMGEVEQLSHKQGKMPTKGTRFDWPILFNGESWAMQPMAHPPSKKPTLGDRAKLCEAIDAYLSTPDAT